jgi:hypothetical protein
MSSSDSGSTVNTIRYAPYVEDKHAEFLNESKAAGDAISGLSPYADSEDIDINDAFFGAGFTVSSFPSLYDMYGKFMAGLDVEVLWEQLFEGTVNSPTVSVLVKAESDLLDDDIEETSLPRFQLGLRDINAVMSSSFVTGKALIESAKVKSLAKFDAELRYRLIPVAEARWGKHLEWNSKVVQSYATIIQLYYNTLITIDERNLNVAAQDTLWPFTVLEFERANIAALQGATTAEQKKKDSPLGLALSLAGLALSFI